MFRGYLDDPDATRLRLRESWFHTGDLGRIDSDGRIHLCGRADDMFTFNSINIYPQDLEAQICKHAGVAEALVLPVRSAVHGSIPAALLVAEPDVALDLKSLRSSLRKQLGNRAPRKITIVDSLPRTSTGKLSRREAIQIPERIEEIRSAMFDALSGHTFRHLKPAEIAAFRRGEIDIPLAGTGLDSFRGAWRCW